MIKHFYVRVCLQTYKNLFFLLIFKVKDDKMLQKVKQITGDNTEIDFFY